MLWTLQKMSYGVFQKFLGIIINRIHMPEQHIITGPDSIIKIPAMMKELQIENLLLVCSHSVLKNGLLNSLIKELEDIQISYTIFHNIKPNPTVLNVEEGYEIYVKNHCQAILAVGGGSPLDCAKIIGIKATNKNLTYKKMRKIYTIKKPLPTFFAIPTTAGSGSESTMAAVISEPETHSKYAISSPLLIPSHVVLDPNLTLGLPAHITSTTGMDALTHAIEAYLGTLGTDFTDTATLKALKLIFSNLEVAYCDGTNVNARTNLLLASNYAGSALNRALVGYVHSISHGISALYDVPHGLANAIILPYVLDFYGTTIHKKLAKIAIYSNLGNSNQPDNVLAQLVLNKIQDMNQAMQISNNIPSIKKEDIPILVKKALKEANPAYPVPKIMNATECESLLLKLCNC